MTIHLVLVILTIGSLYACSPSKETVAEKLETKIDEITKDTKEGVRDVKKDIRDATGNESISKDVGDKIRNAADEAEFQAKKAKRKLDK